MLTWKCFEILSYGAGTPSTTLALMACENAFHGPPYPYPLVPIYDAVIFCDLHAEPGWVYRQAAFTAAACARAGIPFYTGRRPIRQFPGELWACPHCLYPVLDAWRGWREGPYAPPVYL